MEPLVVVTHPEPLEIVARPIGGDAVPAGSTAVGYYYRGTLVARGFVADDALEAIHQLLQKPVALALAATEDDQRNIEARICLVLPIDPAEIDPAEGGSEEPDEPWRASVPAPPPGIESTSEAHGDDPHPRMALLPIGNAVRGVQNRHHDELADDAREMLDNLIAGRAQDAVSKAIDDLLGSL